MSSHLTSVVGTRAPELDPTGGLLDICVVGVGPRGLSVFERLCANAAEVAHRTVRVHLVDPTLGAGARVWRRAQSRHLLINTVASQVTMFVDDSVDREGPVVPGPSLHEWARFVALLDPFPDLPVRVREEALRLGPDTYPTRAFYGHYLSWVLRHLISTAPGNVIVVEHVDRADGEDGRQVVTLVGGARLVGLHTVVLALGHLDVAPTPPSGGSRRAACVMWRRTTPRTSISGTSRAVSPSSCGGWASASSTTLRC